MQPRDAYATLAACDARIKDWKCPYPDFLADNGFSARVGLPGDWRPVEVIFRAQSGFNPLHAAGVELRFHPWRPDYSWRPNRPQDREVLSHVGLLSKAPFEAGNISSAPRLHPL